MDRLFQHYEGEVRELVGVEFSWVNALVNEKDRDVVLIWLRDQTQCCWYRIFIDGVYCGVDRYSSDNSREDMDEGIKSIDHSGWFAGKKVISATVDSNKEASGSHILLTLRFDDKSEMLLNCVSEDGCCKLQFVEPGDG